MPAVDALIECGREIASAQARLLSLMVTVADSAVGVGFDADEVAFALHLPRQTALGEVVLGRDLIERLPAVFASLSAGRIDLARARVFSDLLTDVEDDDLARDLADRFLPPAQGWTASQLRRRLQQAILSADPDSAGQRYQRSVTQRRVELRSNPDTTAQLSGLFLPPAAAAAAFERVDALARGFKNTGDQRTLDQLRADVFCGLLSGTLPTDCPSPVHRPGVVELLVPLDTLTGTSDRPGTLGGYGPVVADIARQVAAEAAARGSGYQWRFSVYDRDGRLLHHGTTRARPTSTPADPGPDAVPDDPTPADAANPAGGTAANAAGGGVANAPPGTAPKAACGRPADDPRGTTPNTSRARPADDPRGTTPDTSRARPADDPRDTTPDTSPARPADHPRGTAPDTSGGGAADSVHAVTASGRAADRSRGAAANATAPNATPDGSATATTSATAATTARPSAGTATNEPHDNPAASGTAAVANAPRGTAPDASRATEADARRDAAARRSHGAAANAGAVASDAAAYTNKPSMACAPVQDDEAGHFIWRSLSGKGYTTDPDPPW